MAQPCATIGNKISDKRVTMSLKAKSRGHYLRGRRADHAGADLQLLKDVVLADPAAAKENAAIEQADWMPSTDSLRCGVR